MIVHLSEVERTLDLHNFHTQLCLYWYGDSKQHPL